MQRGQVKSVALNQADSTLNVLQSGRLVRCGGCRGFAVANGAVFWEAVRGTPMHTSLENATAGH